MIQLYPKKSSSPPKGGFALVIALSLMAFVLVLLLTITTLVRVESSSASTSLSQLEARQNALLSAFIAIGELQRTAGPDQRVTARADILDNSNPSKQNFTGVWSTESTNPGAQIAWLASDWEPANTAYATAPAPTAGTAATAVLVGEASVRSLDNPDDVIRVSMANTQIERNQASSGRYAWWVSDENSKASIRPLLDPNTSGSNETRFRSVAALANKGAAELAALTEFSSDTVDPLDSFKLNDSSSLELAGYNTNGRLEHYHDYTINSYGVLSNTRGGGLKRDLSLAFEMSDADFNSSIFAGGGSNPVGVIGNAGIQAQPVFRDSNGGRGPSWHLLRDYYTIYQRIRTPLTNPVFPAQHSLPNTDELSSSNSWQDYAAMRFSNPNTWNAGVEGDPLLSTTLPYPYRAHYAPYLQRWQQTFALFFEISPNPPAGATFDWVEPVLVVNPAAVYHNPYNVDVEHYGFMTYIDHARFNLLSRRLTPGFGSVANQRTNANRSVFKVAPGTMPAGAAEVFRAVQEGNTTDFSEPATPSAGDFITPSGATASTLRIPEDPNHTGPNVEIDFAPFDSNFPNATGRLGRWAVRYFNNMGSASNTVLASYSGGDSDFRGLYNYSGYRENLTILQSVPSHREWFDNPEAFNINTYVPARDGVFIDTRQHRLGSGAAPIPFFVINDYLKPADDRLSSPSYAFFNPHAPMKGATNLLGDEDGTPIYTPAWQMTFGRSTVPTGAGVLESFNGGLNAYGGNSNTGNGQQKVAPLELPVIPPTSIADLQSANIGLLSTMPALAIGNSYATPYLPRDQIVGQFTNRQDQPRLFHDLSYHINEALWDDYYFSSYSVPYDLSDNFDTSIPAGRSFDQAFDPSRAVANLYRGSLPNPRMRLQLSRSETLADARDKLFDGDAVRPSGVQRSAENLLVEGAFNVNSTSVDAWTAVLAAGRGNDVYQSDGTNTANSDLSALSRSALPADTAYDGSDPFVSNIEPAWSGYRSLTDAQIRSLADAIVTELKARANSQGHPFLTLSAFVNRSRSNDDFGLSGLLQTAIDRSGLNGNFDTIPADFQTFQFPNPESGNDPNGTGRSVAAGAAGHINQGDLLKAIGSFVQVRSDTFKIRSYGEVLDPISNQVESRAWCEITVQRTPEPVYPGANSPELPNYWTPDPTQPDFGRRFKIVSIRFLDNDSV